MLTVGDRAYYNNAGPDDTGVVIGVDEPYYTVVFDNDGIGEPYHLTADQLTLITD